MSVADAWMSLSVQGRWVVVGLVALGWWMFSSWRWPHANCVRCDGVGRFRSPNGRSWRRCSWCKGSGSRERLGRKLLNALSGHKDR